MDKLIWGLFGLVGTGKSSVSQYLKTQGWNIINQDLLGHQVLDENPKELINIFGESILKNSSIDRQKLGEIVFQNPQELQKLVDFSYPLIIQKTLNLLAQSTNHTVIEGAFFYKVKDFIPHSHLIYIHVDLPILHSRLINRGHSELWIKQVLENQQDIISNKNIADITIINNDSLSYLHNQIYSILDKL